MLQGMAHLLAMNNPPAALEFNFRAIELSRQLGQAGRETLMWRLFDLADAYLHMLTPEPAVAPLAEAEDILRELGPRHYQPEEAMRVQANFAFVHAKLANLQGRHEAALQRGAESVQLYAESGSPGLGVECQVEMAIAAVRLGNYQAARDYLNKALALNRWMSEMDHTDIIGLWQAAVEIADGSMERALAYSRESIRLAEAIPDFNVVASNLGLIATIRAKQGRAVPAAYLSGAAKALYARQKRKAWEDSSLDTLLPGWRDRPDGPAISAAFEAGLAMNAEQAVALALGDEDGIL
jgi:tetratricopeptide (TPR) repeat protein